MKEEILIFEVPCRSNRGNKPAKTLSGSYIGNLVLTNERLMFLSSGNTGTRELLKKAIIFGSIVSSLSRGSVERKSAKDINQSALNNIGSWELPLSKIIKVGVGGSTFGKLWFAWLGPHIRISGEDKNGIPLTICVFGETIKEKIKRQLQKLIVETARNIK